MVATLYPQVSDNESRNIIYPIKPGGYISTSQKRRFPCFVVSNAFLPWKIRLKALEDKKNMRILVSTNGPGYGLSSRGPAGTFFPPSPDYPLLGCSPAEPNSVSSGDWDYSRKVYGRPLSFKSSFCPAMPQKNAICVHQTALLERNGIGSRENDRRTI